MTIKDFNKDHQASFDCIYEILNRNLIRRRAGYINEELCVPLNVTVRFLFNDDIHSLNIDKSDAETVYLPF